MAKEIPLTKQLVAIVDDEDFEELSKWKWYSNDAGYACRGVRVDATNKTIRMHRQIMGFPTGFEVDHINHNRCDNRKSNLRIATRSQNAQNQGQKSKGKSSIYKGVSFRNDRYRSKPWSCQLSGQKHIYLGSFATELEAALAYDKKARELFGEFACANFQSESIPPV